MKELFEKLYACNKEDEVLNIVSSSHLLSNPNNWKPYGNNFGNFGTFEGQQYNPIPALIEKITNSIDAVLLKECKIRKIDPQSKDAPKSMNEAVEAFFNVKDGDFSEIIKSKRRLIAESIQVIAVGDKTTPSIIVYDEGEGQSPEKFTETFLSLQKNNKANIKFVQGKYNMGSTGAVVFCGEKKFQLIASKRNPELGYSEFGFTLVRRHPLTKEEEENTSATYYEYFCPNNLIPCFPINELDLGLFGRKFTSGSIIKMYSYELPRGSRSDVTLDLWRDLNQYLYHPALPFILFENREGFKSGSNERGRTPTKPVVGNKTRISLDERDKIQYILSYSIDEPDTIGEIPIEVVVFSSNDSQRDFIGTKSIVFTQNGQVHGFYTRSFVSKELNLPMLKDSLLIHVDCTKIHTSFRQDLFMSNRTHLKEGTKKTEYLLDKIIDLLRKSDELKQINQNRKNILLRDSKEDKQLLESMISKLPIDNDLTKLLLKDGNLSFLKQPGNKNLNQDFNKIKEKEVVPKLNRFPSIFSIDLPADRNGKKFKTIPLNSHGIIKVKTDVQNDYLFRPNEKGSLKIHILQKRKAPGPPPPPVPPTPNTIVDSISIEREGPINGTIKFIISPKNVEVGDEIEIKTNLSSPGKDLECIFWIKVIDPIEKGEKHKESKNETFPRLPKPQKVFEIKQSDEDVCWKDYGWNGEDIVKVIETGDDNNQLVEAIAINMDSFSLKRFISKNQIKSEEEIKYIKDKYFLSIYFHSLFIYGIFDKVSKNGFKEQFQNIEISELITSMFKPYAAFLLYENYHLENKLVNS